MVIDSSPLAQTNAVTETSIEVSISVRLRNAKVINPSWVKHTQNDVDISAFGGQLDYARLTNAPDLLT